MGDYVFLIVLAVSFTVMLIASYKSGYRKGALMALDAWKKSINDMEEYNDKDV